MRTAIAALIGLLSTSTTTTALSIQNPLQQQILNGFDLLGAETAQEICPQAAKVDVGDDGLLTAKRFVENDSIRRRQVKRLSKAVQVPTMGYDDMVDAYDERFAPFVDFQKLLKKMFPLVHSRGDLEHINRLGLLYTFQGSDESLKPVLYMAHQDVVPIDDPADWTYPPFSGHFDGSRIWGRGVSDCKNVLIGLLSTMEDLFQQDWRPTRTIVFAFGFDEESHGFLGAGHLSQELERRYGPDSFEFILDEGGAGLEVLDDVVYALPCVGEKGSIDIVLDLSVPGGHSSIPPPHTGIGIMSEIIYELERQDPFVPVLDRSHPSRQKLECQSRYSPDHVEEWLPAALERDDFVALAEKVASSRGKEVRFTLQSSQAADIFRGGVKTNALPEKISAVVNYRVALHQTPDDIKRRAVKLITPIVEKHNLTMSAFPDSSSSSSSDGDDGDDDTLIENHLLLTTLSTPLNPAPISPTNPLQSATWSRFSGTAKAVYSSLPVFAGKSIVVAGDIMTGNTDTRFYWSLTRNIYRWAPARRGGADHIHTVDESLAIEAHLEGMVLYYDLIRSFDSWNGTD